MVRNRRYAELIRLKKETDYFSNSKMREREPILFDKMIGKFLPEEGQKITYLNFFKFLFKNSKILKSLLFLPYFHIYIL